MKAVMTVRQTNDVMVAAFRLWPLSESEQDVRKLRARSPTWNFTVVLTCVVYILCGADSVSC